MKAKAFILLAMVTAMMSSCTLPIKEITREAKEQFKRSHEYRDSEKWGKVVTVDKEIMSDNGFSRIQVDGNVDIIITQDSTYSLKVTGNEKAIEEYVFSVNTDGAGDKTMSISLKDFVYDITKENHNVNSNTPAITVYIKTPKVEGITIFGAGDISIKDAFKQTENLLVNINGAGDFDVKDIELGALNVTVSGAGDLSIEKAKCEGDANFTVNGAGDIEAKVKCMNLKFEVNGAGSVDAKVKCNEVIAECNGAGDIKLKGECNKLTKKDSPIGGVDSRQLKVNQNVTTK